MMRTDSELRPLTCQGGEFRFGRLLVAPIGIYGVMSLNVANRTNEPVRNIGNRQLAIGKRSHGITRVDPLVALRYE